MAFSRKKIPKSVIAFARELIWQEAELDVNNAYNDAKCDQEFRDACEEVNQGIIKALVDAQPVCETDSAKRCKEKIIRMRIIQAKYDGFYLIEKQFFVRAGFLGGLVFWHQITSEKIRLYCDVFEGKEYQFRCIGRINSIPRSKLKIKDFYYKL